MPKTERGTNALRKWDLSAPTTVNKVKGDKFKPDPAKGEWMRIEKGWISVPDLDAEATGDKIQFQISTKNQNEADDLLEIDDKDEVYTFPLEVEALGTNGNIQYIADPTKAIEMKDISGTLLKSDTDYYFNHLITGQDGAIGMKLKLLCNYTGEISLPDDEEWHDSAR